MGTQLGSFIGALPVAFLGALGAEMNSWPRDYIAYKAWSIYCLAFHWLSIIHCPVRNCLKTRWLKTTYINSLRVPGERGIWAQLSWTLHFQVTCSLSWSPSSPGRQTICSKHVCLSAGLCSSRLLDRGPPFLAGCGPKTTLSPSPHGPNLTICFLKACKLGRNGKRLPGAGPFCNLTPVTFTGSIVYKQVPRSRAHLKGDNWI